MGARPWLAHTKEDFARMLIDRDWPSDSAHARELLDSALRTYKQLGLEARADHCAEALIRA
jgi:hypothetical protein